MTRLLRVSLLAIVTLSCASASTFDGTWAVRITRPDGRYGGGLVLEMTTTPTAESCVGVPGMVIARIIEKHGLDDDGVRDEAAVYFKDGNLYADLSLGMCDHNLVLHGRVRGRRATGEVSLGTLVGSMNRGRFEAEKR